MTSRQGAVDVVTETINHVVELAESFRRVEDVRVSGTWNRPKIDLILSGDALRAGEFARGKKRISHAAPEAREEARQESYRLRAETISAYYLVRLYADPDADQDLVRDAEDVIELSGHISADPETENEMDELYRAATNALEKVVDAASGRLRD
jgi:hypothetical protein